MPALRADAAGVVRCAQGKPTLVSGNTAAMVRGSGLLAFVAALCVGVPAQHQMLSCAYRLLLPAALQLQETWLAPYFDVHGDRSVHYGARALIAATALSLVSQRMRS